MTNLRFREQSSCLATSLLPSLASGNPTAKEFLSVAAVRCRSAAGWLPLRSEAVAPKVFPAPLAWHATRSEIDSA
jgi:hypothetical protein